MARHAIRYSTNTDGDACSDGKEVGSINTNPAVEAGDQLLLKLEIQRVPPPDKVVNLDLNKDGAWTSGDQLLQALVFGSCP